MKVVYIFQVFVMGFNVLPAAVSAAGDIGISAEMSASSIPYDGRDTLIVRLVWTGESSLYQIDDFPIPKLEKLKILGSSTSVSTAKDTILAGVERTTRTYSYILEPIDFGIGIIEPMNVTAKNRLTEAEHALHTGRITVEIAKPVAKVIKTNGYTGFYVILGSVIVVLGTGVIVWVKKRSGGGDDIGSESGNKKYIDTLSEIRKDTIADGKRFYSRVYRLLLQYLEKECGLDVSGKTGEEILDILCDVEPDEERMHLQHFLSEALDVKFRPQNPLPGDIVDTHNGLVGFWARKKKS